MGFCFCNIFINMKFLITETEKERILSLYNINEQFEINQKCKSSMDNLFKESKDWLTKWINSSQFRKKITVGQPNILPNNIDNKIKGWLNKIPKITYRFEKVTGDKDYRAWYNHGFKERIYFNEAKINCDYINNKKNELKSVIVHEMIHCLENEVGFIGNSTITDKIQNMTKPEFISPETNYYLSDRDETVAYIYGTRVFLNLKPNEEITDTKIVNKLNEIQKQIKFNVGDTRNIFKEKFFKLPKNLKLPNLNVLLVKFFASDKEYLHLFLNDVNLLAKNNSSKDQYDSLV